MTSALYRESSSLRSGFDYVPVYVVRDTKLEIKPFYRGKQAEAKATPSDAPETL